MRITLFCHDLSSNAFGRAYLLADVLRRRHEVEVAGPILGEALWPPCDVAPFPVRAVPGGRWPGFISSVRRLVRETRADVCYAVKAMPSSMGVAWIAARAHGIPWILDTDDWELGFQIAEEEEQGVSRPVRCLKSLFPTPRINSKALVGWMERLSSRAPARTTVSAFLDGKYGGGAAIVPHVRDLDWLDPERHDGQELRASLGLKDRKTVLYLGSARSYKGVEDLVEAASRIEGSDVTVLLVGTPAEHPLIAGLLQRFSGILHVQGPVPFADMPRWIAAADLVVLPQRRDPRTLGQMPAKLTDAMAMARPVVATDLADIGATLGPGGVLVPPGDVAALSRTMGDLLTDPDRLLALGRAGRLHAEATLGYDVAAERLEQVLARLLKPIPPNPQLDWWD